MIQLFLDGKPVQIKSTTKIKLTLENSFFSTGSEYTYEVELPLALKDNRAFFGAMGRLDVAKPTRQYKARLMYNNRTVLDGAANITQITNHSVKLQLLGQLAMHNSNDKEDRVYIDELDLGNFAMDLAPEVYGKTATGPAFAYGRTDGRNTLGADSWANDPNKPIQFYPCRNTSVDAVANDWAAEVNAAGTGLMISWIPCKWREGLCRPQRQPSGVTIDAILFSDAGMAVIMFFLLITMAPLLFVESTCMRHASSRSRAMRSTSS